MSRLVCFTLLNLFSIIALSAAEPYYYKATAKDGDGVYSLLRRYDLANENCNVRQFYKLNNLKKDANLLEGKKYFLPILIYSYDSKSIRSTIGIDDWDKAVSIKRYNENILSKKLRRSTYTKSNILWVPFSAIYCGKSQSTKGNTAQPIANNTIQKATTSKSPGKTMKTDNLFGSKYASYQEVDRSLKNKVFYIVSGHGGPDPGAMCTTCPNNLCEDEYAYDVALRLARNLKQHGAKVEMIIQDKNDGIRDNKYLKCDTDERCNGRVLPAKQKKRLAQRASHINALHAKYKKQGYTDHAVVAIHVDAAGESARKDVYFYHHKNSKKGKQIAYNIHNTFKAKYEQFQKGRGYKGTVRHRGLYMINNTNPPIVYIELANIHNPNDQQRIILDSNRQALANWIFKGLIK